MIDSLLVWQDSFNHTAVHEFMVDTIELPVAFVVLYLWIIFGAPDVIKNWPTEKYIRVPMILWNAFLSLFSILGTYYLGGPWLRYLTQHGVRGIVCDTPEQQGLIDGAPGFWLILFILSKIPEAIDTIWLVLQKKPVIVLHGWHHATVALYCWQSFLVKQAAGPSFAIVNYLVHSIMYAYFAAQIWRLPILKKGLRVLSPYITMIQTVQMFGGMFLLLAQRYYNNLDSRTCPMHRSNNLLGLCMYASYAVLFSLLFRDKYCSSGDGAAAAAAAKTSGGKGAGRSSVKPMVDEGELCNATASAMTQMHGAAPPADAKSD